MRRLAQQPVGFRPALVLSVILGLPILAAVAVAVPAQAARAAAAGSASGAGARAASAAADPVVAQVAEMLRAGIGEPVIFLWLEKTASRPRAITSADLVALHQAGGSDALLKKLVELAAAATPQNSAAAAGSPPSSSAAPVKVRFAVSYRPVSVEQEDLWAEHWTLYLYLDGRFLAAVRSGPVPLPLPPHAFERELSPGKHVLRLAQERHLRYSAVGGYLSPSRVDPSELPFELAEGAPAQVEIRFGESSLRHPGPVGMRVEQDHKEISRLEPGGANPERWPALCEDVAASLPAGAKLPATARRDLEHCLHWTELWPGIPAVPTRAEVRAASDRGAGPPGAAPK